MQRFFYCHKIFSVVHHDAITIMRVKKISHHDGNPSWWKKHFFHHDATGKIGKNRDDHDVKVWESRWVKNHDGAMLYSVVSPFLTVSVHFLTASIIFNDPTGILTHWFFPSWWWWKIVMETPWCTTLPGSVGLHFLLRWLRAPFDPFQMQKFSLQMY